MTAPAVSAIVVNQRSAPEAGAWGASRRAALRRAPRGGGIQRVAFADRPPEVPPDENLAAAAHKSNAH